MNNVTSGLLWCLVWWVAVFAATVVMPMTSIEQDNWFTTQSYVENDKSSTLEDWKRDNSKIKWMCTPDWWVNVGQWFVWDPLCNEQDVYYGSDYQNCTETTAFPDWPEQECINTTIEPQEYYKWMCTPDGWVANWEWNQWDDQCEDQVSYNWADYTNCSSISNEIPATTCGNYFCETLDLNGDGVNDYSMDIFWAIDLSPLNTEEHCWCMQTIWISVWWSYQYMVIDGVAYLWTQENWNNFCGENFMVASSPTSSYIVWSCISNLEGIWNSDVYNITDPNDLNVLINISDFTSACDSLPTPPPAGDEGEKEEVEDNTEIIPLLVK